MKKFFIVDKKSRNSIINKILSLTFIFSLKCKMKNFKYNSSYVLIMRNGNYVNWHIGRATT